MHTDRKINVIQSIRHKVYKDTNAIVVDNMEKETKTIRVSIKTLDTLKKYGKFGDNWDKCIQRVVSGKQTLMKQLKQMRQKKQKKRKTQKKEKVDK